MYYERLRTLVDKCINNVFKKRVIQKNPTHMLQ